MGELVGTGGTTIATLSAFQFGNDILHLHATDEGGNAFGIAVATAIERDTRRYREMVCAGMLECTPRRESEGCTEKGRIPQSRTYEI